jgi:HD-like signal output (HDOD) protein
MQNLFRSKNKVLNNRIHQSWKQSIRVSSISHTLASLCKNANPDEALLAGLTHNIGSLPIIIFADSLNSEEYSSTDLSLTINTLQGLLGNIILKKWGFPDVLAQVPRQSENWYHSNGEKLDLSDIVLLAKFHSYLGSKQMQNLPPLHTLPAFKKLGDNALTPDMSLLALHNAKQQISEAISLFST